MVHEGRHQVVDGRADRDVGACLFIGHARVAEHVAPGVEAHVGSIGRIVRLPDGPDAKDGRVIDQASQLGGALMANVIESKRGSSSVQHGLTRVRHERRRRFRGRIQ